VSQPNASERLGIAGSGAIALGLARLAGASAEPLLWARSERSAVAAREALGDRAEVVTELGALEAASVVVEAVVEDLGVKTDLLARLGATVPADAILATATSSLPITELARASGRPERFAAIHFFNPVERMELVEVAFPDEATADVRSRVRALCRSLGKTAVEVPAEPGFVVNRLLFPYLFSAVRLLEQTSLEPDAIDTCMKLGAGHPMGPLALLDLVGLDVAVAIGASIAADVPERLRELVTEGRLGRKAGAGFYDYTD
jgi:3-hydroxybutyryl-CoA dehydrogenase